MENIHFVEFVESADNLDENLPNLCFLERSSLLLLLLDLMGQITVIGKLHDNADI